MKKIRKLLPIGIVDIFAICAIFAAFAIGIVEQNPAQQAGYILAGSGILLLYIAGVVDRIVKKKRKEKHEKFIRGIESAKRLRGSDTRESSRKSSTRRKS